jgi:lauroyl/myristoyl acyltransferase
LLWHADLTAITTQAPAAGVQLRTRPMALDGAFWRRTARYGASRAPWWFVRWLPPVIGAAIALAMPEMRRRVSRQLERARGPVGALRDASDVLSTFASFASCLTELLSTGSKNGRPLASTVHRSRCVDDLLASEGGVIFATAHTAGWESLGELLAQDHQKRVIVVMQRERDDGARALQDAIRQAHAGVQILHVGGDPLSSLPLARHLREGGVVALQIDRVPPGMASRSVRLFERPGAIPEGPLRLSQLTGAPIVPVFSTRTGHRRYDVHVDEPVFVDRRAAPGAIDAAAQRVADALSRFVSAHPTQWFSFHD